MIPQSSKPTSLRKPHGSQVAGHPRSGAVSGAGAAYSPGGARDEDQGDRTGTFHGDVWVILWDFHGIFTVMFEWFYGISTGVWWDLVVDRPKQPTWWKYFINGPRIDGTWLPETYGDFSAKGHGPGCRTATSWDQTLPTYADGGVSIVFVMENPIKKWMMTRATPILGNHLIDVSFSMVLFRPMWFGSSSLPSHGAS